MDGFYERLDSDDDRWFDILVYTRELTEQEIKDYQLDKIEED